MTRRKWTGLGALAVIGALAYSVRPGTLYVRVEKTPWTSITLSGPINKPVTFTFGQAPRLWPIQYGRHTIAITFADGRTAWLWYYHYDAGVRKRAEVVVERLADGETLKITQRYNGDEGRAEGTVPISNTSPEKPYLLDGPA